MKTKNKDYPNHKTISRWASKGYLPRKGARGKVLWTNWHHDTMYLYYAPDQVEKVTREYIDEYFKNPKNRDKKYPQHNKAKAKFYKNIWSN